MRTLRFYRSWSVTAKFVAIYVSILLVSLTVTGFILYVQASQSAVSQAQTVMEQNVLQTKNSISEKVNMIENISQIISFDSRIQTLLGSAFINESFQLEDYRYNVVPILDNMMRQNPYIHSIHVYMDNETIPELYELYDGFYGMKRIRSESGYRVFLDNRSKQTVWRDLHLEKVLSTKPGNIQKADVFSYNRKIYSIQNFDVAGLVEIEVTQNELFQSLKDSISGNLGSVFVIDEAGKVVSGNLPGAYKKQTAELGLAPLPPNEKVNEIQRVNGVRSIVISIPLVGPGLRVVGVFPVSHFNDKVTHSIRMILIVLAFALLLLSLLVYFVTVKLLSRMKLLLKAMKQVREGSLDVSVPVVGSDEFSQMTLSFNHMTSRIHDLVETVYKSELLEKEAELKALESQINPHFLYNTLATISWVARKAKAPDVTQIANALAKFYRLVLNKGSSETLLANEVEMVKAYLHIQKFRFEDRFDAVFEIEDGVMDCYTPKNILQPIIENALNHGIEPKRSHGTIIIRAGIEADRVVLRIIDDGVGMAKDRIADVLAGQAVKTSGSGYAVKNIMDRLQAYYGETHSFELFSRPGIGTVVTITFAARRRMGDV
ncbi:sensor histidine kinase [Paenibacillus sp. R14(2021)]|uniref:cache domain-containing sensor histidine kinase n=1 Tax=Paenibacillus sp. R14(2021) TaxID=2859228 RepID=UPI001C6126EE|nr:sensor histidine kinase [Paenibacillus sp. R14(2021)]